MENLGDTDHLHEDLVIADNQPYLSAWSQLTDLLPVLTKAALFDVRAVMSTVAINNIATTKGPELNAGVILNMVKPRSAIARDVIERPWGQGHHNAYFNN